jgi:hypothetical protein
MSEMRHCVVCGIAFFSRHGAKTCSREHGAILFKQTHRETTAAWRAANPERHAQIHAAQERRRQERLRRLRKGIKWDNILPAGTMTGSLKAFFSQFDDAPPNEGAKRC